MPQADKPNVRDQVATAIAELPERQKLVVALYAYERASFEEIGQILGSDGQTVEAVGEDALRSVVAAVQSTPPEDFPRPAILGPDGEPLAPGSGKCAQLETSATEISEEMISAIRADPTLVYELSPRRFEELVAELGKGLYWAMRSSAARAGSGSRGSG